mmetsp:Transcript_131722/g.232937  ORF Transcript_131722/g.232937 Transcript_131722/m.232937 type:complete len:205 (-) Transcript_131722:192-806(-)
MSRPVPAVTNLLRCCASSRSMRARREVTVSSRSCIRPSALWLLASKVRADDRAPAEPGRALPAALCWPAAAADAAEAAAAVASAAAAEAAAAAASAVSDSASQRPSSERNRSSQARPWCSSLAASCRRVAPLSSLAPRRPRAETSPRVPASSEIRASWLRLRAWRAETAWPSSPMDLLNLSWRAAGPNISGALTSGCKWNSCSH